VIVLIVLVALVAGAAIAAGAPWPLAIVVGIALPFIGSTLYLRITHQDAPTTRLTANDPRTRRFLALLIERYRAEDYEQGAATLEDIQRDYDLGDVNQASERFAALSSSVAHSPYATMLISIWQETWRDAGKPAAVVGREQAAQSPNRQPEPSLVGNPGRSADIRAEPPPEGPWATENVERDAGLFVRAVLFALLSSDVSATARGYAAAIGRSVTEGDEKSVLVLLSALTYYVGKVQFLRDDPFADPDYLPYSRLLATQFMSIATQCLPGPTAPRQELRIANAARLGADMSGASMALVEALEVVGSSALETVA
jgi:hypothetical protein